MREPDDSEHMLKLLGVGWTAWKLTRKRFGTVGGFLAAAVIVAGYLVMIRWLQNRYPGVAERLA